MINHRQKRQFSEQENGCHLKNVGHMDTIFDVHTLRAYVHIQYTSVNLLSSEYRDFVRIIRYDEIKEYILT